MKNMSAGKFLLILLFLGCTKEDFFFLRNEVADMQVHVTGNKESGIFILFLHGGPGNGSYIWEKFFGGIEDKYAMVFWDQRAAGSSQGNAKPGTMTVRQFVEDTHKVVLLINKLYNNPTVFLMGHSWGGLLGTAYLLQYPDHIRGWIEVDGAHNKILGAQLSRQWVISFAHKQVDAGKDLNYWQDALDWYSMYTGPLTYSSRHYTEYLDRAHAYYFKSEPAFYSMRDFFFGSPNGFDLLLNGKYSDRYMEDEIVMTDLTPEMSKIQVPSLLCWGRHDGALPAELAQDAYDALSTPASDKSIVYFEESAHSPMIEEPVAFSNAVGDFVEEFR